MEYIKGDESKSFLKTNISPNTIQSELFLERPSVFLILLLFILLYCEKYLLRFFKRFNQK